MTDEMLELARANQREAGVENVEFLKGTIEDVPLPDDSVDVVISNCVINLSADKPRSSGRRPASCGPAGASRSATSSPTPTWTTPPAATWQQWTGCIAGALTEGDFQPRARGGRASRTSRSSETHRVHEHAVSAIVRAEVPHDAGRAPP